MNYKTFIAAALLAACALPAHAVDPEDILAPSVAFQISGVRAASGEIYLSFDIAPGYALYRDKIHVTANARSGTQLRSLSVPHGQQVDDLNYGAREQWRRHAIVTLTTDRQGPTLLDVKLQGCADVGVCFNPEVRHVLIP